MTAREDAIAAAAAIYKGWGVAEESAAEVGADAASDVWEPLLRAMVELGPMGHRLRPIDDADLPMIRRANAEDPRYARSEKCWECDRSRDTSWWDITKGITWGDHIHQTYETWLRAKEALG